MEEEEKKKKRSERFGLSAVDHCVEVCDGENETFVHYYGLQDRKKLRAARFGTS